MTKCDNIPCTHKKTRLSKQEVEKEFEESLIGENHNNKGIQDKVDKIESCKEATVVIREFEELIRTNKNNIASSW